MQNDKRSTHYYDDEMIICRCEEITFGEIRRAIQAGAQDVDAVKRMTRAGMGLCQSKSCYDLIANIIHSETNTPYSQLPPFTVRPPVRPIQVKCWPRPS